MDTSEIFGEPISVYSLDQALADGTLVNIFENRWPQLSGGKPMVATAAIAADLDLEAIRGIWNDYVRWRNEVEPTLPEEDRLFDTKVCGRAVWVIEDGDAFTILYPEDYGVLHLAVSPRRRPGWRIYPSDWR